MGYQARLDRAIVEARASMSIAYQLLATCGTGEAPDRKAQADRWTDTFAALVALRARYEEHDRAHYGEFERPLCGRCPELDAEAERVLGGGA